MVSRSLVAAGEVGSGEGCALLPLGEPLNGDDAGSPSAPSSPSSPSFRASPSSFLGVRSFLIGDGLGEGALSTILNLGVASIRVGDWLGGASDSSRMLPLRPFIFAGVTQAPFLFAGEGAG